ncbi:major head protein [Pseudomonas phage Knedl]|nr:major head protein [Pseudomonas phage Knedl]
MSQGVTRISDVVVPEIFTGYVQQITRERSRLIQSSAVEYSQELSNLLGGGGLTFNIPSFKDLDNDEENISSDDPAVKSTPNKIGTATEVQVRLSRNNSWSSMDLTAALAGPDPMNAIANRVSDYWVRRLQQLFVSTVKGVFAANALAAPAGNQTQNDMIHDISGSAYVKGVTDFSAEAFIDGCLTMGDRMEDLRMVMVHSVVYARMQKNNLIDFIPDARGEILIPTFLGREVIVDDGMPTDGNGVFETWIMGAGAFAFGQNSPKVPTAVERKEDSGNGGGQEILYNRVEWAMHPKGYAFIGQGFPNGGPSNASSAGNLAAASSWSRAWSERKMIRIAKLVTREY